MGCSVSGKRRILKSSKRSTKSTILATSCGYQEASATINPIAPLQQVSRELRESKKQAFTYRFVLSFSCVQKVSTKFYHVQFERVEESSKFTLRYRSILSMQQLLYLEASSFRDRR